MVLPTAFSRPHLHGKPLRVRRFRMWLRSCCKRLGAAEVTTQVMMQRGEALPPAKRTTMRRTAGRNEASSRKSWTTPRRKRPLETHRMAQVRSAMLEGDRRNNLRIRPEVDGRSTSPRTSLETPGGPKGMAVKSVGMRRSVAILPSARVHMPSPLVESTIEKALGRSP